MSAEQREPGPLYGVFDIWKAELQRRKDEGWGPVPTGIKSLDEKLGGGIPCGYPTVLAAQTSTGKTSFMIDLAIKAASREQPVVLCTLEMTNLELGAGLGASNLLGVGRLEALKGCYLDDPQQCQKLRDFFDYAPMNFVDAHGHRDLERICISIRECVYRLRQQTGRTAIVFVDYAQLLIGDGEQRAAADAVAGQMKSLAQELQCAMVLFSQVARTNYSKSNAAPTPDEVLRWAKESGRWEADAAAVLGLARAGEDTERYQRRWIVVAKNRMGGSRGAISLLYDGLHCTFEECDPNKMPAQTSSADSLSQRITDAVRRGGHGSANSIYNSVGGSRKTTLERIKEMADAGIIVHSDGVYAVAEEAA